MILTPENVLTVEPGTIVMVENPATGTFVECRFEEMEVPDIISGVYLTTTASNVAEGVASGDYHKNIHHLRSDGLAVMSREELAEVLVNKNYEIR